MATHRQSVANQKNAQLSTGPKTPEGKVASRANSYKHGLRSEGVVLGPEPQERYETRLETWRPGYAKVLDGADENGLFLYEEMIFNSILVEEGRSKRFDLIAKTKERAILHWDADRKLLATDIAEELRKKPGRTVAKLMTFLQGAQWLLREWSNLHSILESGDRLNEAQTGRLLDLMGLDPVARSAPYSAEHDEALEVVEESIAGFDETLMEALETSDYEDRVAAAERGFTLETSRETILTIRYSDAAFRRFSAARKELLKAQAGVKAESEAEARAEPPVVEETSAPSVRPSIQAIESSAVEFEKAPVVETVLEEVEAEEVEEASPSTVEEVEPLEVSAPNEPSGGLGKLHRAGTPEPEWKVALQTLSRNADRLAARLDCR